MINLLNPNASILQKVFNPLDSSSSDDGGCIYTFENHDGTTATIKFNAFQYALYENRISRKFNCGNLAEYKSHINKAVSIEDINKLGEKQGVCDICDFSALSVYAAKNGLLAVLDSLVRFPELRSKICFLGSDAAFERLYKGLEGKNKSILNKFGLEKIFPAGDITKLAKMAKGSLSMSTGDINMAVAFTAGGFCDGIVLREKDFSENVYKNTLSNLRYSTTIAYSPKGCYTIKSVIDHEVGHMLDYSRSVSNKKEVMEYYKKLSAAEIKNGLSEYASTSINEFIAEGYSEFCNHSPPREMAKKVASFIHEAKGK